MRRWIRGPEGRGRRGRGLETRLGEVLGDHEEARQALTAAILACGYDVLVDATFLTRARRGVFADLARASGAGFAVLALVAPMAVLRQRVAHRLVEGRDASEASVAVLERQAAACERLSSSERRTAITINSTAPPPSHK